MIRLWYCGTTSQWSSKLSTIVQQPSVGFPTNIFIQIPTYVSTLYIHAKTIQWFCYKQLHFNIIVGLEQSCNLTPKILSFNHLTMALRCFYHCITIDLKCHTIVQESFYHHSTIIIPHSSYIHPTIMLQLSDNYCTIILQST